MELDSMFSTPRWRILEILAKKPSSPLEISNLMKTSIAYISQQLKLLEAAGIVLKVRTRAVEKGMARNLYSLAREIVHFTVLLKDYPIKKTMQLTEHQKAVMKIWLLTDVKFSYELEKLLWEIEPLLGEVKALFVEDKLSKLGLVIMTDSKLIKIKIESLVKKASNLFELTFANDKTLLNRNLTNYLSIYDPLFTLEEFKKMKGGNV